LVLGSFLVSPPAAPHRDRTLAVSGAADLRTSDVAPAAHALFVQRTLEFGKDTCRRRR
jgi:hypothetical protein